jgi:hypothetical protein
VGGWSYFHTTSHPKVVRGGGVVLLISNYSVGGGGGGSESKDYKVGAWP